MNSNTSAEHFRTMSDCELYVAALGNTRYDWPIEIQLALFQEIENRKAAAAGRDPLPIMLPEDPKKTEGAYGYNDRKSIVLNPAFFDRDMADTFSSAKLLETVFHEGRHQTQYLAVCETGRRMETLPLRLFHTWGMETVIYINKSPWYDFQWIEVDARMFALDNMKKVEAELRANGIDTTELQYQIAMTIETEMRRIAMLVAAVTLNDLKTLEKAIKKECRQKLGLKFSPFTHLYPIMWFILQNKHHSIEYIYSGVEAFYRYVSGIISLRELTNEFPTSEMQQLAASLTENPLEDGEEIDTNKISSAIS